MKGSTQRGLWSILLFALSLTAIFLSVGAKKKEVEGEIQRKDLEYVKCDVCKRVSAELAKAVNEGRNKNAKKVIGEMQIVEIMDNVCKPRNDTTGAWTRLIDIEEKQSADGKTYLELVEPGGKQLCNRECATLAKSCDSLLEGEIDADDFSAYLYRTKLTAESLEEKLCKKLTKRCVGPKKSLPKDHSRINEPFTVMDEQQVKKEELSAMMREAGVRGDLKHRDEMEDMLGDYMDDDDSEESVSAQARAKRPFAPPGYAKNSHEKDDDEL